MSVAGFMKTNLKQLFIIGASSFLLAGCCSTHHVTRWEYKAVREERVGHTPAEWMRIGEALMDELGKDGWILVTVSEATYYFKRPVR
jgi:hypothetical protein